MQMYICKKNKELQLNDNDYLKPPEKKTLRDED